MNISHTLLTPFVVEGVGLHTGEAVRVNVRPAVTPGGRVFFQRGVKIPALVDFVTDTHRCTTIGRDGQSIRTVEHLLAAMMLAGLDHAEIEVEGPELPALDGAALQWYSLIRSAGVCPLEAEIPIVSITQPAWLRDGESDFFLFPAATLSVYAALDVPATVAQQRLVGGEVDDPGVCAQILRARTWGLEREVQALLANGLGQGGSLDNAVILTETGYVNDQVWPDEPAWHKVLDLLGDLALSGARIAGRILAVRGGHRSHVVLVRQLRQ
jgi:UDP-3-O-[3-hydroxymyristoyl] N-acetylglucosamine deacetylase